MWLLYGAALAVSLTVHHMGNAASGAWIALFMGFLFVTLFTGKHKFGYTPFNILLTGWFVLVCVHAYLIRPSMGGALYVATFGVVPLLNLVLMRGDSEYIISRLGAVAGLLLGLFAAVLIFTKILMPHYWHYFNGRASWPMLNPNNAGTVMLFGLIPAYWFLITERKLIWLIPLYVFGMALACTVSFSAMIAAAISCGVCTMIAIPRMRLVALTIPPALAAYVFLNQYAWERVFDRWPIWKATWPMIKSFPVIGVGLGNYPVFYSMTRTEHLTQGMFAHNDLLQIAATLGIPMAILFVCVWVAFFMQWRMNKSPSVCAFEVVQKIKEFYKVTPAFAIVMAVFIQSLVDFPLYLPPVQLLLALTVVYVGRNVQRNTNLVSVFRAA